MKYIKLYEEKMMLFKDIMIWNSKRRHFSNRYIDMKQFTKVEGPLTSEKVYGYVIKIEDVSDYNNVPDRIELYLFNSPEECVESYQEYVRVHRFYDEE